MAWKIEYDPRAIDDLNRLDRAIRSEIVRYLETRVTTLDEPRSLGKPLRHELGGLWRFRLRDYRIICQIKDKVMVVLVVGVGHRRHIYR